MAVKALGTRPIAELIAIVAEVFENEGDFGLAALNRQIVN